MSLKLDFTNQDLQKMCSEASTLQEQKLKQFYLTNAPNWKETIGKEIKTIMRDPARRNAARLREDPKAFYYKFHFESLCYGFRKNFRTEMMERFIREFNEANEPAFSAEENTIAEDDGDHYFSFENAYPGQGDMAIGICWYLPHD